MDPYAVLGLPRSATKEQIKAKYRELARLWHPDKVDAQGRAGAEKKMQEINRAYEAAMSGSAPHEPPPGRRSGMRQESGDPFGFASKKEWDDIKRNFSGAGFEFDEEWMRKMKDAFNKYQYTYDDFAGKRTKKCPHCNGTGEIPA